MAGVQNTGGGTTVSFGKTPQAHDDIYAVGPNPDNVFDIALLDVLANDQGGAAKSLWSLDSGTEATAAQRQSALLGQDSGRSEAQSSDHSSLGARIWITADGKVGYDASTIDASKFAGVEPGGSATDTFTYAIRLGNGTLSWATVEVDVRAPVNHQPVAVADGASVKEDASLAATGNVLANDTDADSGDTHTVTAVNGSAAAVGASIAGVYGTLVLNANGSYTYTLANGQANVQSLADGQQVTDVFTYTNSDNHTAASTSTLTVTVTGGNDAPVLAQLAGSGGPVFADDSLTLSGVMAFSDIDLTDAHTVTITAKGSGYVGAVADTLVDSTGSGQGTVSLSFQLTKADFLAAFPNGQLPPGYHQDYLITIDDHHGGTSSQTISIPLADILAGVGSGGDGGGGSGGASGNNPPVITYSSADQFPTSVWDNPAQATLTTNGIIDFQDPDAHDPHLVQVLAAPGNWGQLNWHLSDTSDSGGHGQLQWDYLVNESVVRPLAAGESHADHFTFRIFDSTGNFVDKPVTVWDFGSDEPPIVQAPNPIVVNVSAGQPISTSGTFSFTDADRSDTHHVEFFGTGDGGFGNGQFSATLLHDTVNGSGGLVQWNFNLDPSGLQYLGAGETASATWVVNIVGNNDALVALGVPINGPGMSTTENVTFVVNGVNDLPYFRTAPVTLSETPFQASPGSAFGVHHSDNIGFGDPDMHDTHFVFAQFNAQQSNTPQLGHLAVSLQGDTTGGINVNGIVHYDYDYNSNVFNYADLPAYGNAHQVYDIVLQDNHGGQTVQSFTIDLHFPV